ALTCARFPPTATWNGSSSCASSGAFEKTPPCLCTARSGKCRPTSAARWSSCASIRSNGPAWRSGSAISSSPSRVPATSTSMRKSAPVMTTNASTPEAPSLDVALKTLWGASRWPGFADSTVVVTSPSWDEGLRRLHQLVAVRASGLVHGPNGVGKSFLVHRWSESLSPKKYRLVRVSHSTLMGSDLLRQLVALGGKKPNYRRGDNVLLLAALWQEWAPVWPVIVVAEAQDLNPAALEELRLLTCARADTQTPFSLILVGDEELVPRLELGVNRALVSRMGFCLRLESWSREALA